MRAITPLALTLLLSAGYSAVAGESEPAPRIPQDRDRGVVVAPPSLRGKPSPEPPSRDPDLLVPPPRFDGGEPRADLETRSEPEIKKTEVSQEAIDQLNRVGYSVEWGEPAPPMMESKAIVIHTESGVRLSEEVLERAQLKFAKGSLVYKTQRGLAVDDDSLGAILKSLHEFSRVADLNDQEVGKQLMEWGVPPSYDGYHLLNPDGSATYYGKMLYQGLKEQPERAKDLSGERLSSALGLFRSGYRSAFPFNGEMIDVAAGPADIRRAFGILTRAPRAGETKLDLTPYDHMGDTLGNLRTQLSQGPSAVRADMSDTKVTKADTEEAIAALNQLERHRYHRELDLPSSAPPPPRARLGLTIKADEPPTEDKLDDGPPAFGPPRHTMLPKILSLVDRMHGTELTPRQQEAFIKSFPLGESVWRMGAHELWREGLQGQGMKAAIIDTGVGSNREIDGVVKSRQDFTGRVGPAQTGGHATHVAGTIHAIAPQAEIRSYRALSPQRDRSKLNDETIQTALVNALDAAYKDGNQVINMSLGRQTHPGGVVHDKIRELTEKGVTIILSAGNRGGSGVSDLAQEGTLTIGALNAQDRATRFSSFGDDWDPTKGDWRTIPRILMAPGENITSTMPAFEGDSVSFTQMNGTSMAAPHISGASILLRQAIGGHGLNPVTIAGRVSDSLFSTGRVMPLNELPVGTPLEQEFIIADPVKAYRALNSGS